MSPLLSSRGGGTARGFGWSGKVTRILLDTFARINASSLGISSGGKTWSILRGSWAISSNAAQATSSASTYGLAAMDLENKDATVELASVSNGVGPAVWITDSNNWHAAVDQSTSSSYSWCCGGESCSCGTSQYCCGGPCSCGYSTGCCGACACPSNCSGCGSYQVLSYWQCYTNQDGVGWYFTAGSDYSVGYPNCPCCSEAASIQCTTCWAVYSTVNRTDCACPASNSCCSSPCDCGSSYGCCPNCSCGSNCCCGSCTGYNYYHYLSIIKMVGGAVSSVGSAVSLSSAAASIRVVTNGSGITAYAYAGTNFTSMLNSIAATSTPGGTQVGILHSSSSYNQGTTASGFRAIEKE